MICVAEIPAIDIAERPCYYRGAGRTKGSYIRVGDADLPMTDYELYSYKAFRKHLHDDERPVERATLQLLDMEKMRVDRLGFSRLTQEQTMEMLNVTRNGIPSIIPFDRFQKGKCKPLPLHDLLLASSP